MNNTPQHIDQATTRDPETYAVIGAAIEVHKVLGHGFLEAVYHEALFIELQHRKIVCASEVPISVVYKSVMLETCYRADFVAFQDLIIEIKALDMLGSRERGQLLNYLKASGYRRGLLINFGAKSLQYERLVWGYS